MDRLRVPTFTRCALEGGHGARAPLTPVTPTDPPSPEALALLDAAACGLMQTTEMNFLSFLKVKGRGGRDLHDTWGGDARAYLGMTHPGFPNLFTIYGPNTNIVVNGSIIFFSECAVRYIAGCLKLLAETGAQAALQ